MDKIIKELIDNIVQLSNRVAIIQSQLSEIDNPTRCECIVKGYDPRFCRKRPVCSKIEKEYHTDRCWKELTTAHGLYTCICNKY